MSEQKHTPEPMFQYEYNQLARYEDGRTPVLLTEEQYRRAHACVNACAGLSTQCLEETGGGVKHYIEVIKQRDELLAALEKLTDVLANIGMTSGIYDDEKASLKEACDAIASAKCGAA